MKPSISKNIVLVAFLCFTFSSCKKATTDPGDTGPQFPITVYADSSAPKAAMRMFVGGVEITDTAKISKFYKNVPAQYTGQDLLSKFPGTYTFKSTDSLKLSTATTYTYTAATQKSVIITSNFSATNPLNVSIFDYEKFFFYQNPAVAVTGGFNLYHTLIGYGNYTNFKVPVLTYKYRRPLTNNATALGITINEFDPSTVGKLLATDTLAVQEFVIYYKAKPSM